METGSNPAQPPLDRFGCFDMSFPAWIVNQSIR